MQFLKKLPFGVLLGFLLSLSSEHRNDAQGADAPKFMYKAPKDWTPTRLSDSVIFYDAPALKKGEECRISVSSRIEDITFTDWFKRVQSKEPVIEASGQVEGKTKGGYEMLRLSKIVKTPSDKQAHRLYLALRDGKRMALILCTASSEDLLKTAVQQAEAIADSWDYKGEFPASRAAYSNTGVVYIKLPAQDITLSYVERRDGFTVELETNDGSIEAQRLYIGDGKIAALLYADPSEGIFLQGVKYKQGDVFRNGSTIKVRPGYKNVSDLKSGDLYVTLPGIKFELPEK